MLVLKQPTDEAAELDRRILAFMRTPQTSEAHFERLALDLFLYQYRHNQPYRQFCDQRGRTPASVINWQHIPAVAAASFGDARLASFSPERSQLWFESSGTTSGGSRASRHELETTQLYDASLALQFRRCVMPDRERMPMYLFSPSFLEAPHSSLAYMLANIFEQYGAGGGFCIHEGALDYDWSIAELKQASEPVLVFGTTFALVHFIDHCRERGVRFQLPQQSRLVETGGFKGRSRSLERVEFYAMLGEFFGLPRSYCLSEYGMCELGSQWYDGNLADQLAGRTPRLDVKIGPHWARHLIVDEVTAEPMHGTVGLLQLFDLSNRGSVAAVLSADLARDENEGFVFMGRAPGAPPKGCSITADALLSKNA